MHDALLKSNTVYIKKYDQSPLFTSEQGHSIIHFCNETILVISLSFTAPGYLDRKYSHSQLLYMKWPQKWQSKVLIIVIDFIQPSPSISRRSGRWRKCNMLHVWYAFPTISEPIKDNKMDRVWQVSSVVSFVSSEWSLFL